MRGDRPTTGSELAAVFAAESKFPFCVIYSLRTYMCMCMSHVHVLVPAGEARPRCGAGYSSPTARVKYQ